MIATELRIMNFLIFLLFLSWLGLSLLFPSPFSAFFAVIAVFNGVMCICIQINIISKKWI